MGTLILIDEDVPVVVSFVQLSAFSSSGTSITVPVSFGDEASGRKIIVAVHLAAGSGSGPVLSSPTIGGVAATIFDGGTVSDVNDVGVRWIGAEVPTGTSGNVQLTFSTTTAVRLGVWRMTDAESLTKTDSDPTTWGSTESPQTITTNVTGGGVQFAAASVLQDGGSFGFTAGISATDYNQSITGSSIIRIAGGFELITSDEVGRAATLAKSGGGAWRGALAGVSFR